MPRPIILDESLDLPVTMDDDGNLHLKQAFEVPEGTLPVRMQVGGAPVTIVGWVATADALPELFENIAEELRKVMAERDTPND